MYFLEQIRSQLMLNVTLCVGWPEWGNETIVQQENNTPENEVTPGEALDHARKTTTNLKSAVVEQEKLWLTNTQTEVEIKKIGSPTSWDVLGSFSVSENELEAARLKLPEGTSEEEIKQNILQEKLDSYHNWELPLEDIDMIETMFSDAWIGDIPSEISMDALEAWEIDDFWEDASPEQLASAGVEVSNQVKNLDVEIASMSAWPEREVLEKRRWLLWWILDILEGKNISSGPFAWVESNGSHNVIWSAKKHLWIHEDSWNADKFLMWMAQSARKTPWCAGFVSYVCKEAGYDINPTLSSKAFIGETGKWHVAFNCGWWLMLWWNQSNTVSLKSINKPIQGWILPEDYAAWKEAQKTWDAPVGAIIVFDRWSSQRNWA